jgi:hypothetical protein
VRLVDQWRRIEQGLPQGWGEARLSLAVRDEARVPRAAALLGPAAPGRTGSELVFGASRRGNAVGPDAMRRLLRRLDDERIRATLTLVASEEVPRPTAIAAATLEGAWQAAVATLPADWSDLLCEVELTSSDHLPRVALLLSPLNPSRQPGRSALRFRCARRFGYGASAEMVRRCLARVDDADIRGRVAILRALADTHNVATQGPVWHVDGKAV